ncbi:hypothetical protein L7F22_009617 [Adiantum nelumboides]|nr:hypothetical protein [Adiantum nelumboides]
MSSSSKGKGNETSKANLGEKGKQNSNQTENNSKDGLDVNQTERRRTSFARSPSGLSLSRPKSLLAPSRPSPLTPSVSSAKTDNNQPPHLLSASPSSRSIIDRNHASGITASTSNASLNNREGIIGDNGGGARSVSDGGALSRLRRVASNASLASSIKRFEPSIKAPSIMEDDKGSASVETSTNVDKKNAEQSSVVSAKTPSTEVENTSKPNEATEEDTIMAEEGKKRALDGNSANDAQKNQKRRTWFGFIGGSEDVQSEQSIPTTTAAEQQNDSVKADNSLDVPPTRTVTHTSDDQDGQRTIRGPPSTLNAEDNQGTIKSWIPWRNQEDTANDNAVDSDQAIPDQSTSYTDSVRRYIGWSSTTANDNAAHPTSTNSWAWSTWNPYGTNSQVNAANDVKTQEVATAQAQPTTSSTVNARAMELKPNVNKKQTESTASTASPSQSSFIYRWVPTWSRGTAPSQQPAEDDNQDDDDTPAREPTTPAEQYKAEALALLDAKGAVLNPATRSTWINYFSSRSAASQPKIPTKNLDEPEVMRIESGTPSSSASPKLPPNSGKSTPLTPSIHSKSDVPQKSVDSSLNGKRVDLDKPKPDPAPANSRPATPLTNNKDVKAQQNSHIKRLSSSNPKNPKPTKPTAPNLLLPSFDDTFSAAPRSITPKKGVWEKTISLLFNSSAQDVKGRRSSMLSPASQQDLESKPGDAQARLPRLWSTMGEKERAASKGCKDVRKVTIIGIHGWFSQGPIRNLFGEPTGTSTKFASMMTNAVRKHFAEAGYELQDEQITIIALEADGLVSDRVDKSFSSLLSNPKWVKDLLDSDAIFVAAHSQGSIVATHLLARLVEQRHLNLRRSRIALLCMCGIHNGPFAHLKGSITSYYMNTFETPAAKELFEFQNGHSPVSRLYAASLRIILAAGIKLVYIASLDDQVVPLYSALHTAASHPSILRGIFCDGAAFPRVDFLTNLLSFCVNVRNAGMGDHHLATLLSSSVAGSLYGGLGHSLVYDEPQVYNLAARYCLEVTSPAIYPTARPGQQITSGVHSSIIQNANLPQGIPPLDLDDEFTIARNQKWNSNPYALPWSLRGLFEDERVRHYFSPQIDKLVRDYLDWQPTTKTLKDVQFRLEPMRFIATSNKNFKSDESAPSRTLSGSTATPSNSKL